MGKFQLETRYIVFKKKHLDQSQEDIIYSIEEKLNATVDCVVIEEDWPEYETVVAMLRDRVENDTPVDERICYHSDGTITAYSDVEEKWITLRESLEGSSS